MIAIRRGSINEIKVGSLSFIKRLKQRLQFTGWLQYIPIAILALTFFLVAAFSWLIGYLPLAYPFVFIGSLLLTVFVFDLFTVKFRLHPPEHLPKRNDALGMFDLGNSEKIMIPKFGCCEAYYSQKGTMSWNC